MSVESLPHRSGVLRLPVFMEPVARDPIGLAGNRPSLEFEATGTVVVLRSSPFTLLHDFVAPCIDDEPGAVVFFDPDVSTGIFVRNWLKNKKSADKAIRYDPFSPHSPLFNVLASIRIGTSDELSDVQAIARSVCDPHGLGLDSGSPSDSWRKRVYVLLSALILHVLRASAAVPSLSDVARFVMSPEARDLIAALPMHQHDPRLLRGWVDAQGRPSPIDPIVSGIASDFRDAPESEQFSILSILRGYLRVYLEPLVARSASGCDFSLFEIAAGARVSLFLSSGSASMEEARPLLRVLLTMIVHLRLSLGLDFGLQPLLLIMNGFTEFGMIPDVQFLQGYGVSFLLASDGVRTIESSYPRGRSPLEKASAIVALGVQDSKTAEYVSQRLERVAIQDGTRGGRSRALMTADEILAMPSDRMLIMRPGGAAVIVPCPSTDVVPETSAGSNVPVPTAPVAGIVAATSEGAVSVEPDGSVVLRDASQRVVGTWTAPQCGSLARAVAALFVSGGIAALESCSIPAA